MLIIKALIRPIDRSEILIDIYETDDRYILEADLPGVRSSDINICFPRNGQSVIISGKFAARGHWMRESGAGAGKSTP